MGETSRVNCHPFVWRNWTFMHNGQIGDFGILRRSLEVALDDRLYNERAGTTDSEILFLLALQFGLETDPHAAFVKTIRFVVETARKKGLSPSIRFTSAFSCGSRLYAIRYATDAHAPTLFWARDSRNDSICLVSEPFEDAGRQWHAIAANSFVTVENGCCTVAAFDVWNVAAAAA